MTTYHFTFTLAEDARDFETWAGAVYDAGGNDSSPGVLSGKPYVSFDRHAACLEDALRSAASTIHAAGLKILRCELDADELSDLIATV